MPQRGGFQGARIALRCSVPPNQPSGRPGHGNTAFSLGYGMRGQAAASLAKESSETSLARGQKTRETRSAGALEWWKLVWLARRCSPPDWPAGLSRGCGAAQISLVSPVRARRVIPCGPPSCSLRARQTKRLRAAIGWPQGHQPVSPTLSRLTLPECRCSRLSFGRDWAVDLTPPRATAGCLRHSSESRERALAEGCPITLGKLLARALKGVKAASADDPVRVAGGCPEPGSSYSIQKASQCLWDCS